MSIASRGLIILAVMLATALPADAPALASAMKSPATSARNDSAGRSGGIHSALGGHQLAAQRQQRSSAKANSPTPDTPKAIAQRHKLRAARLAIERGDQRQLKRFKRELSDHPLRPYIDYWDLSSRLSQLPYRELDRFFEHYQHTAIGDWLRGELLRELGRRERFRAYLKYYRPEQNTPTRLRCYYADALARHGNKQHANALTRALWTVGDSQPKACDPVFKRWMAAGGLTPALTWQRHYLALAANNLQLAGYIAGKMPASQAGLARLMQSVYRNPRQLMQFERFNRQNPQYRDILLIGLRRLAVDNGAQASAAWAHYAAGSLFSDQERDNFLRHLALQLAKQDNQTDLRALFRQNDDFFDQRTTEWLIRQSLRELDWSQVRFWINRLPEDVRSQDRWLYWQARVIDARQGGRLSKAARRLYQRAASGRSYYGFLAADRVGQSYRFIDRPVPVTRSQIDSLAARADLRRAQELQAIGEVYHARREWNYATADMNSAELMTASKLANTWGWHQKSIQSILAAGYLDDLTLRFPLGFAQIISQTTAAAGTNTALDPYLVYAVTRQESHFRHDVKSDSGALGLMQLLPSTARVTARRAGVSYRREWDLLTPKTNIALGTHYLNSLLRRFDNNRFLAAAAYNAGPTQVSRWLRQSKKQLPHDVWIETIPFSETRNYVQRVLSYRVIYAYRSGKKTPLLRASEVRGKF